MSDFNPLVSIVIPVYNGANYLTEAIDSALAQTYRNIEILVVNDGSKDEGATRNIALSYGDRIRYIEKENGGVATALNLGIEKMQGEYFSWLSHDDKYYTDKIENQIDFLSEQSNKEVVLYSDLEYIDENSNHVSNLYFPHYSPQNFRPAFIKDGIINGCTLLVPKKCFEECGLFDPTLRTTQDYDLWFRISEKFSFFHQPGILIESRLHQNQDTVKLQDTANLERDNLHLFFIKSISKNEIEQFSSGNISGYYIAFATKMALYMCLQTERFAINQAVESLFKSGFLKAIQNTTKLFILFLLIGGRSLLVFLLGYDAFVKLKKVYRKIHG